MFDGITNFKILLRNVRSAVNRCDLESLPFPFSSDNRPHGNAALLSCRWLSDLSSSKHGFPVWWNIRKDGVASPIAFVALCLRLFSRVELPQRDFPDHFRANAESLLAPWQLVYSTDLMQLNHR